MLKITKPCALLLAMPPQHEVCCTRCEVRFLVRETEYRAECPKCHESKEMSNLLGYTEKVPFIDPT